jgi:hypothetical protein
MHCTVERLGGTSLVLHYYIFSFYSAYHTTDYPLVPVLSLFVSQKRSYTFGGIVEFGVIPYIQTVQCKKNGDSQAIFRNFTVLRFVLRTFSTVSGRECRFCFLWLTHCFGFCFCDSLTGLADLILFWDSDSPFSFDNQKFLSFLFSLSRSSSLAPRHTIT